MPVILQVVRCAIGVLAIAIAVSGCGASKRLPTLAGEIRPATWTNGDGSWLLGGLDGTGQGADEGHIRWTQWTMTEAHGWGVGWERARKPCSYEPGGCPNHKPFFYKLESKRHIPVSATDPVDGQFLHLRIGSLCVVDCGPGVGFFPAHCNTWHLDYGLPGRANQSGFSSATPVTCSPASRTP